MLLITYVTASTIKLFKQHRNKALHELIYNKFKTTSIKKAWFYGTAYRYINICFLDSYNKHYCKIRVKKSYKGEQINTNS